MVDAHCAPRPLYICVAKSGNAAPNNDRIMTAAANADAAAVRYVSMIYANIPKKIHTTEKPTTSPAIIGAQKDVCGKDVHPNQKMAAGKRGAA